MKSIEQLLRPAIAALKPYSSARDEYTGEASVFLDANENPYNQPYNRYPDPYQRSLKEKIAKIKVNRKYKLNMPKGVNSRSSDNTLIKKVLKWNYTYSLYNGLSETYKWIENIYLNKDKKSIKRFTSK